MTEVFRTPRLCIVRAEVSHAELYHSLWTDPRVMAAVGFPRGIPAKFSEIRSGLLAQPDSDFDRLLVVVLSENGSAIGECFMHSPGVDGIASTDVKLLPEFWGRGFGREIKRGMLTHLFSNTDCVAVEATPSVNNIASIRMQESVGGVREGENVSSFPEEMSDYTLPVHHYIYRVTREIWKAGQ